MSWVHATTTEKAKARLVVKVRASIECCATAMPALVALGVRLRDRDRVRVRVRVRVEVKG